MKHAQKSPTCTAHLFIPANVELGVVVGRCVREEGGGGGGGEGGGWEFPHFAPCERRH